MADTWSRRRRGKTIKPDPHTRVDALAARRVLRDCYRVRTRLAKADSAVDKRLGWILAVTLLRSVGHVLKNIDSKRSPYLAHAIRSAYQSWKVKYAMHLIFHEFIENERNAVIKEYRIAPAVTAAAESATGLPGFVLVGDQALTPDSVIGRGIRWWEDQLYSIEQDAAAALVAETSRRMEPQPRSISRRSTS